VGDGKDWGEEAVEVAEEVEVGADADEESVGACAGGGFDADEESVGA
jgi:hypothetical protein